MFHWRHWADIANHVLLILPASFLLIRNPNRTNTKRGSRRSLTVLLWAPTLVSYLAFNPKLGWWRDWDLFALMSAPAIVVIATVLAQREKIWSLPRRVAAVALALMSLSLWTWVHVSESASVTRFESLLPLDSDRSLSGYENLARYWRERREWKESARILGTALETQGHTRLFTQRGIAFSAAGMLDSALVSFQRAIAADSASADGYFGSGQILWLMKRSGEALPFLQTAVSMDSARTDYRYQLGVTLRDVGEYEAALPHLAYASNRAAGQPMYANAYAATLFGIGESAAASTILQTTVRQHPNFSLAYANLAWILYQSDDYSGAEAALQEYERQIHPTQRIATAVSLRQTLDSLQAEFSKGMN
jgi:tetratricopeptide (TPR) repeat protein